MYMKPNPCPSVIEWGNTILYQERKLTIVSNVEVVIVTPGDVRE